MIYFAILALGMFLGAAALVLFDTLIIWNTMRKIQNETEAGPLNEELLCDGPHKWIEVPVTEDDGKTYTKQLCTECGFISGWDQMLSKKQIETLLARKVAQDQERQSKKDFLDFESEKIKTFFEEELKGGLKFAKLLSVYHAGQISNSRYAMYLLTKTKGENGNE